MLGLGSLDLSKIGNVSSVSGIATNVINTVSQGVQDFNSNPFANISKTGSIDGNNAKNQQIIVNNGNINIGDNTGNVGNVDSNNGNVSEKSQDNNNIIQKLLAMLMQLLSGNEEQNAFAGNMLGFNPLNMLG